MGFDAIHASGSVAHRVAGYADAGLLTLTEMADRIADLADAVDIPIVADADTGFGNVPNVIRTIKEYERAGAAAIHLEDQVTPRRPTHQGIYAGTISHQEMVSKIKAALDARTDESMIIIARSEVTDDFKEVLERLAACLDAGADAAWFGGARDDAERQEMRKTLTKPLVGVLPRGSTLTEYQAMGANCAVLPGALQIAAIYAQRQVLEELKQTGTTAGYFARLSDIGPAQEFYNRQGNAELAEMEKRYPSE
jgi:2-methylisocitrate lyase-like PEP mutase family enzyme